MKIVCYELLPQELSIQASTLGTSRLGLLLQDKIVDVEIAQEWAVHEKGMEFPHPLPNNLLQLLERGEKEWQMLRELHRVLLPENLSTLQFAGERLALEREEVSLLCPLDQPRSFRDFDYIWKENKIPKPVYYFSNPATFLGNGEKILKPKGTDQLDFELEIACIIGKRGRDIPLERAVEHIFGFAILNDWSLRDLEQIERTTGLGLVKAKEFATSLGPAVVTLDELKDRRRKDHWDLQAKAWVNDQLLFQGNVADLSFSFSQMIAYASQNCELMPGDVIGSGTVGAGSLWKLGGEAHRYLESGDLVRLEVERLGVLENEVL